MKESIINYLKEHGKSSVNDIAQTLNHAGGEKFPQLIKAKVKKAISNIGLSFRVFMIIHRLQPIRLKKLNESK